MIEVQAFGSRCFACTYDLLTAGSRSIKAHFTLGDEYAGMEVTACWRADGRQVNTPVEGHGSIVDVPAELLEEPGVGLEVGVYGRRPGRTISTTWARVGVVRPSTYEHHH